MESPKHPFIATGCCAFCQGPFPPQILEGVDAWQSNVRAVLCLDTTGQHIELTEPTCFPNINCDVNIPLTGHSRTQIITLSRSRRISQKRQITQLAFCFHDWCCEILTRKLKSCNKSIIYKLARTLTPDSSKWENVCEQPHDIQLVDKLQFLADSNSHPLSKSISKLPAELKTLIWRYTGLITPFSAFILVTGETLRLARHLYCFSSRDIILEQGLCLSWQTISVFTTEYLRDLIINEDCKNNFKLPGDTTVVRYITVIGGICAIRLFGISCESGWIGKVPSVGCGWYGMMKGRAFRYDYNDLNCVAVSPSGSPSTIQVVWDWPDFPSTLSNPESTLFSFRRDILHSVIEAPRRCFFRYLSLYCGVEYTNGLTVYVSTRGIVGLEAHFTQISRMSGSRHGCALYFPLCAQERIVYTWLRIVNSPSPAFIRPILTIQTSQGRIYTFGPYILPSLVVNNCYRWILLKNDKYVSGLYYENTKSGKAIMRLGAVGSGPARAAPLLPQYYNCDVPSPPISGPNVGLFLSVATLSDLQRVDVCRVNNRYTGMLLHYFDGHTAVLGQWQTFPASCCSCIYNNSRPSITDIYFRVSKSGDHQIVTNISFVLDISEASSTCEYQVFTMGEHIAWWFSEQYDLLSSWTGDLRDVPGESIVK